MTTTLDPNDFVDTEKVFEKEYNGYEDDGRIYHASWTIVPGDQVTHTALVYWKNGIEGTKMRWGISMYYGYRYNGQDIPIGPDSARHILENLAGAGGSIEETEWAEQDSFYAE